MAYITLPTPERTKTGFEAFTEAASPYLQQAFAMMMQRKMGDYERQKQMEMQEMQRQRDIQQATELGLFQPQYEQAGRDIAGSDLKYPQMLQPQEQSKFYSDIGKKKYEGKSVPSKYLKFSPEGAKTLPPGFQIPLGRMQYNVPSTYGTMPIFNISSGGQLEQIGTAPRGAKVIQEKDNVAREKFDVEQEEKKQKLEEKTQFVRDSAQDTLNTIAEVEKGINEFGLFGQLPSIPGTQRVNWEANVNKLLSGKVIDVMTKMKEASKTGATGFGQLSEKELAILQGASTALKRGLPPQDAQKYLNIMKTSLQKVIEGNIQQPQGQGQLDFSNTSTEELLRRRQQLLQGGE